ncbi:MAG: hypothetical protein AAF960_05720 [Bacteroidota bacterium]
MKNSTRIALSASLILLTYFLGYETNRTNFPQLIGLYGLFFVLYIGIFKKVNEQKDLIFFVGTAILLRFILLFALPNFSDDLYRFIWDGRLLVQGINPFDRLPSYYIDNKIQIAGITESLYAQLNSPNYFTIYPPVNQAIFAMAAWLCPDSIWGSSLVMKSWLWLFEIGSIVLMWDLLKYFHLPAKNVLLYALNPLTIFEITGNIHFEGAMIFFLLLALWLLVVKKWWIGGAITMALSVASKLLPLMFFPLLIRRVGGKKDWHLLNWQQVILFFTIIGITLIGLYAPLLNGVFFSNFGESLNLYFQKFEFNASVYYVLRWIGYQYKGYNVIQTLGPFLALGTLVIILGLAIKERLVNWFTLMERMLFAICVYLLCTTTVHPWYVAMPVALCVFTPFRFPILWSGLIFLTYVNYSYSIYTENLCVVGVEYLFVLGCAFYELRKPLV